MNIQGRFFLAVIRFGSFLQKCDKFVQVFYNLQPGSSKGKINQGPGSMTGISCSELILDEADG